MKILGCVLVLLTVMSFSGCCDDTPSGPSSIVDFDGDGQAEIAAKPPSPIATRPKPATSGPKPPADKTPPASAASPVSAEQVAKARALLATLADDAAGPAAWRAAAFGLGSRYDQDRQGLMDRHWAEFLGEAQRRRLIELLPRRMMQLCAPLPNKTKEGARLSALGILARSLARVAPEQAQPWLAKATPCACFARPRYRTDRDPAAWCGWFFAVRAELGEDKVLDNYARWLGGLSPEGIRCLPAFAFLPAWRHPEHPAVAALLVGHFGPGAEADPWTPIISTAPGPDLVELVASPLLGAAVFRDHIAAQLKDRGPALPKTPGHRPRRYDPPPDARVCDLYAEALSKIEGMPAWDESWPEAKRDQAIAAMQAFLREHGSRLGETDDRPAHELFPSTSVGMQMKARLRMQSLPGPKGDPVILPDPPVRALWRKDGTAKPIYGLVHQGAEQEIDGRPRRFYRFVWKNGVEILPAEALDFRGPVCFYGRQDFCPDFMLAFGWPEPGPNGASGSLDFQPFPPNIYRGVRSPPWKSEPDVIYRADRPLWMSVFITNRRGYERSVPVWTGPLPADKRPAGLRPILMGPGGAVARRQDAEPLPPNETKNLLPGESTRLFKLDLNAHFVVKTPGAHSLQIDFEGGTGLPKASIRQDFTFPVERK